MSRHIALVAALLDDMRLATDVSTVTLRHLEIANQKVEAEKQHLAEELQLVRERLESERLASAN